MRTMWRRVLPVSLVAAVMVTAMASLAFAGDASGTDPSTQAGIVQPPGRTGMGGPGGFILGYIKGKTGVDLATLLDELKSGKTIDEIAAEHNIDLTDLKDEIQANSPAALLQGLDKNTAMVLTYIARTAGVDLKTLVGEYNNGASLADIAKENGLDLATIQAVIKAAVPGRDKNGGAFGPLVKRFYKSGPQAGTGTSSEEGTGTGFRSAKGGRTQGNIPSAEIY